MDTTPDGAGAASLVLPTGRASSSAPTPEIADTSAPGMPSAAPRQPSALSPIMADAEVKPKPMAGMEAAPEATSEAAPAPEPATAAAEVKSEAEGEGSKKEGNEEKEDGKGAAEATPPVPASKPVTATPAVTASAASAGAGAGAADSGAAAGMETAPDAPPAAPPAPKVDLSKHPSGIVPTLENIVCTANLHAKLELTEVAMRARNAEYNPRRFSAVIIRIRDPRTTALVFASGKMVVMGAKSENDAQLAAKKFTKMIKKTGVADVKFRDFKTHNVVGCADVKFKLDLESLSIEHADFCTYDPELFPGLTYRLGSPDVVLLVFASGKVVLTKAKHRDHVYAAFEKMYPILEQFKKK